MAIAAHFANMTLAQLYTPIKTPRVCSIVQLVLGILPARNSSVDMFYKYHSLLNQEVANLSHRNAKRT
jgi:hypothetical protein